MALMNVVPEPQSTESQNVTGSSGEFLCIPSYYLQACIKMHVPSTTKLPPSTKSADGEAQVSPTGDRGGRAGAGAGAGCAPCKVISNTCGYGI